MTDEGSVSSNIVALLRAVERGGHVSLDKVMGQLHRVEDANDDALASAWHFLSHFATDEDIRSRDSEMDLIYREKAKSYISSVTENCGKAQ